MTDTLHSSHNCPVTTNYSHTMISTTLISFEPTA